MSPQTDIAEKIGPPTPLDEGRAEADNALKYPHNFWGGYKGHTRGMLTGTVFGGIAGGLLALVLMPFTGGASLAALPALAGAGLLIGAEEVGSIGASTGTSSAGLAEKHARLRDPANAGDPLKANQDKLMYGGNGHHYEFPPDRDRKKLFHWKSGLAGAIIGIVAGALVGMAAPAVLGGAVAATFAMPVIGSIVFGLFGLSFGIERGFFKSIFNGMTTLTGDRTRDFDNGVDIGLQQELAKGQTEEQVFAHRLERQEDIHNLQEEYDQKLFASGVRGYVKGLTGGAVVGILVGAAVGLIALGILALAHVSVPVLALGALFAAGFGTYFGKTFAEAGKLAGTESAARALDDEFERKQILQAQGIYEAPAIESPQKPFFHPVAGVTMGIAGAAIGAAMAPAVIPLLGVPVAAFTAAGVGASATIGGLLGVLTGFSNNVLHGISKITNTIYKKTYAGDPDEEDALRATSSIAPLPYKGYVSGVTDSDARKLEERLQGGKNSSGFAALYNQNKTTGLQIAPGG